MWSSIRLVTWAWSSASRCRWRMQNSSGDASATSNRRKPVACRWSRPMNYVTNSRFERWQKVHMRTHKRGYAISIWTTCLSVCLTCAVMRNQFCENKLSCVLDRKSICDFINRSHWSGQFLRLLIAITIPSDSKIFNTPSHAWKRLFQSS